MSLSHIPGWMIAMVRSEVILAGGASCSSRVLGRRLSRLSSFGRVCSVALYQEGVALPYPTKHGRWGRGDFAAVIEEGNDSADETVASEAFAKRSNTLRAALTRFFSSRGIATSELDDLVQDVFLRIVRRGTLSALDNLEAYVFATAQSVLTDRARKRATRLVDRHVTFHPEVHGGEDLGPDRIAAGREQLSVTTRALMELPERVRQVFILRRLEGMHFAEIAVRLGISLSSAEKDMQRAIRHVVACVGENK